MNVTTRIEAIAQGYKRYFTGKLCKYGHIAERLVIDRTCVECKRIRSVEYSKNFRTNNHDQFLKDQKTWRDNNPSYYKNYYRENTKKLKQWRTTNKGYSKVWLSNNPQKVTQYRIDRKSAHNQSVPSWYKNEHGLIKQLYQQRNHLTEVWGIELQVDHIIPLNPRCGTVCGLHCWANLQLLDKSLNLSKQDKYTTDW